MSTRDRILDGAAQVMRTRGLAYTTTKEIARAAGFSEATLYKVFEDKVELFLCVLAERLPSFSAVRDGPAVHVGRGTVEGTLETFAVEALLFYVESFPIAASLYSDPKLLARHREGVHARGAGPHKVTEAVGEYLRAEQQAGRIAQDADPEAAATLLVGGCFQRAFLLTYAGESSTRADARRFATALVRTLMPALRPD